MSNIRSLKVRLVSLSQDRTYTNHDAFLDFLADEYSEEEDTEEVYDPEADQVYESNGKAHQWWELAEF